MNVLSLFDGISCARLALDRACITVDNYYASEIDKYAEIISQNNRPEIYQIGDVKDIYIADDWLFIDSKTPNVKIDLLIGGSPCQDLSIAKKDRKGLDWERSGLFWEYLRILRSLEPKYFILENVASMPNDARDLISKELWVEPIMINAALVSAQNRRRYFWTNIPGVTLPEDKGIYLKDVLEDQVNHIYQVPRGFNKGGIKEGKAPTMNANAYQENNKPIRVWSLNKGGQGDRIYSIDGKSVCLSANGGGRGAKTGLYFDRDQVRKLTPVECERLQGVPDNYTDGVSNAQRYKALGNAFNVDVISHILSFIK